MDEIDSTEKPSLNGPLTAVLLMPVLWWFMYEMATEIDPSRFGRNAAFKAILNRVAETLGPTGCVILGFLTTGAAAFWLFRTNQEKAEWEKEERLEAIRARQRYDQARREVQSRDRS